MVRSDTNCLDCGERTYKSNKAKYCFDCGEKRRKINNEKSRIKMKKLKKEQSYNSNKAAE